MSTQAATAPPLPTVASAPKPRSIPVAILGVVLPAVLAAAAAYGGARAAGLRAAAGHEPPKKPEVVAPGPTVPLEPFLVTLQDGSHKTHPMKIAVAVEFDASAKEDVKTFVPRLRDGILAHVRGMTYEQAVDSAQLEKLRSDLLERCRASGATRAERVLITDLIVQ